MFFKEKLKKNSLKIYEEEAKDSEHLLCRNIQLLLSLWQKK